MFKRLSITLLAILMLPYSLPADVTAASCNNTPGTPDVQQAIDKAVDGERVIIPNGTCHWTQIVTVGDVAAGTGRALTITGSGATVIQVNGLTIGQGITVNVEGSKAFRLTNITFEHIVDASGNKTRQPANGGVITLRGKGWNCRFDHLTFLNVWQHIIEFRLAPTCLFDNVKDYMAAAGRDTRIEGTMATYPVGGLVNPTNANVVDGHGSMASALMWGVDAANETALYGDAFYVEDYEGFNCAVSNDVCTTAYAGSQTLTDGESGLRIVVRKSIAHNLNLVVHGTEGGENRGTAKTELYSNIINANASQITGRAIHLRSGQSIIFDNVVNNTNGGNFAYDGTYTHYRDNQGVSSPPKSASDLDWGKCAGFGPYDSNGGSAFATGTHTGPNDTSVLEDSAKYLTWTDNQLISGTLGSAVRYGIKNTSATSPWNGYEGFLYSNLNKTANCNGGGNCAKLYTTGDHSILAAHGKCNLISGDYAAQGDSQPCWKNGDSYEIRQVLHCVEQAGWHSGAGTTVISTVNGINTPTGFQGQRSPVYGWNNTVDGAVQPLLNDRTNKDKTISPEASPNQTVTIHIPNYDFFNQAHANNPACSSAFDGTCGVGIGTLAQMNAITPTVDYVGWWATDATNSNWDTTDADADGALYRWVGGAWVRYYTPLTYPHPLRGSSPNLILSGLTPDNCVQNSTCNVTLTGQGFNAGSFAIQATKSGGSGFSIANIMGSTDTARTADFVLTPGATTGIWDVTVSTVSGTSTALPFNVTGSAGPTISSLTPNSGRRGDAVLIAIGGTNLNGTNPVVTVNGSGVSAGSVNVISGSSAEVTLTFTTTAAPGLRVFTYTTDAGSFNFDLSVLANQLGRRRILR